MQGLVEELKRLRAAEESAMTALVDEEMTARFSGDVTLTVRDAPTVLSPDQARFLLDPCMCASCFGQGCSSNTYMECVNPRIRISGACKTAAWQLFP